MNTRRYPRTLVEAFGPYTSAEFDTQDPMPVADRIVVAVSAIGALALVGMAVVGWLQ
jgi:hypothetical protein